MRPKDQDHIFKEENRGGTEVSTTTAQIPQLCKVINMSHPISRFSLTNDHPRNNT